jgi:hypothetical protein
MERRGESYISPVFKVSGPVSLDYIPEGAVGALGDDLSGEILKVEVKDHNGILYTLWESGSPSTTPVKVTVGTNWELRVTMRGRSTISGSFTMAASVIAPGVDTAQVPDGRGCLLWAGFTGGEYVANRDFQMGAMPEAGITITRIKMFMSPNRAVTDLPPESEW